jgi:hypothetical protein
MPKQKIVVIFEDTEQRQGFADAYFEIEDSDPFKSLLILSSKEIWTNPESEHTQKQCPYPVFGDYDEKELYVINQENIINQIKKKYNPEIVIY